MRWKSAAALVATFAVFAMHDLCLAEGDAQPQHAKQDIAETKYYHGDEGHASDYHHGRRDHSREREPSYNKHGYHHNVVYPGPRGPTGNGLCALEKLSSRIVQHKFKYGPQLGTVFEAFTINATKQDTVAACLSGSFVVGVDPIQFSVTCSGDGVSFSRATCHQFCQTCPSTSWPYTCTPTTTSVTDPIFGMPWASPTNTNYGECLGATPCTTIDAYSQFLGPACTTVYPASGVINVDATFKVQCCSKA